MSAQPQIPPQIAAMLAQAGQGAQAGQNGAPQVEQPEQGLQNQPEQPVDARPQRQREEEEIVQQIIGGELPGSGLIFPSFEDMQTKQVPIDVEQVRSTILRGIHRAVVQSQMPYGGDQPREFGEQVLKFAQAWVLLSAQLDQNGIPLQHHVELSQAAQALKAKTEPQGKTLKRSRGQKPTPSPRV